jgi:1-propanol dehydrogenase
MEKFSIKTELRSGAGAVASLAELGAKRVFLVTDPFFAKNGTAQRVADAAKAQAVEIFDRVEPDPTVELAAMGTARLREFGADLVIALGGGSAMDCAKAMAWFAKGEYTFVAIPTTSGSGSEVTDFAVLTHGKVKHPLVDDKLRPDIAILDSDLLETMPKGLVADTGFDVLAHAVEAIGGKNAGQFSDMYAREAFRCAYGALPASFAGRTEVRLKVHVAATMAGIAFSQAGLGLCHALSHSLGGLFHVPHGRLNAILLPSVISFNAHVAGAKYAQIARAAGVGGSADSVGVRNLRNNLIRLRRDLKLPETLAQTGVPPREVWAATGEIVKATLEDPCCGSNPVAVEDFVIRRILEEVTGRV